MKMGPLPGKSVWRFCRAFVPLMLWAWGVAVAAGPEDPAPVRQAAADRRSGGADEPAAPETAFHDQAEAAKKKKWDWRKFQIKITDGKVKTTYSRKGLKIESANGRHGGRLRWRLQSRYAYPFDKDPLKDEDYGIVAVNDYFMRRARIKSDGHFFGDFLKYNYEQSLRNGALLNLYADVKIRDWFRIRGGQWKSVFTRERFISSGKQQFVERSIVNRPFTLDRQAGISVFGRLMPGTRGDSWYHLELLTGTGRGNGFDDDGPMLVGRYEWNFLGRALAFSSSDLEYHESPAASVAIAAARNRSRYTRFSGSGGGQVEGFEPGEPGQYSLKQVQGEFFLKYRGLSIQNENHWKNIYDHVNRKSTDLRGAYAQAGYFPHYVWKKVPKAVEVGYRYAFVDRNVGVPGTLMQEHTVVVNVFIEGHDNKLSFEVGRVSLARVNQPDLGELRYRFQWDVSF